MDRALSNKNKARAVSRVTGACGGKLIVATAKNVVLGLINKMHETIVKYNEN